METHTLIVSCLVIAAVSFTLATAGVAVGRVNLLALGLLAVTLSLLVPII